MEKRKTHTSYEVKKRHKYKTYKQISAAFRYDSDWDIIQAFEYAKNKGVSPAELIRELVRGRIEYGTNIAFAKTEEENTMKQISIDNGHTFVSPAEALEVISIDVMAEYMDDDTREAVSAELAPCTDEEFLTRYLEQAEADLIIG